MYFEWNSWSSSGGGVDGCSTSQILFHSNVIIAHRMLSVSLFALGFVKLLNRLEIFPVTKYWNADIKQHNVC